MTNRSTPLAIALLLGVLGVAAASGAAVAQSDEVGLGEALATEGDQDVGLSETLAETGNAIGSTLDRLSWNARTTIFGAPDTGADEYATDFEDEVESNSAAFVDHANAEAPTELNKTAYDVIKVEFVGSEDSTATRYVVATVNNSYYQTLTVVNSTDRTVDWTIACETAFCSKELDDDVAWYDETYVDTDESPTRGEVLGRLGPKYSGQVNVTEGSA